MSALTADDIGLLRRGRHVIRVGQSGRSGGVLVQAFGADLSMDSATARAFATLLNEAADCEDAGCIRNDLDTPMPAVVSPAGCA